MANHTIDPSPRDQSHTFSIPKQGNQRSQESMLVRIGMMLGIYKMMSEEQRAELLQWEHDNLPHGLATSDWTGWEQWIAPLPANLEPAAYVKKSIPKTLRTVVFERDGYRCVACGDWHDLTCDHIIPESKGGPTTLANLQTLCRSCNSRKGTR